MAHQTTYKVPKRRKKEGKTNYRKRLSLLLSHKPRFVVRKTLNNVRLQVIEYQPTGDVTISASEARDLRNLGYKGHGGNSKTGYLVGYLGGKKALSKKVKGGILDIGMVSPVKGSVIFAVLQGLLDAGLDIPHNSKVLPPAEKFAELKVFKDKIDGE